MLSVNTTFRINGSKNFTAMMERAAKFDIVVYVPYDKETMFLRELYIMNVLLYMPSPRCYIEWFHQGFNMCAQRINWLHMPEPAIQTTHLPSPNSVEVGAMEQWLNYSLFVELPHVQLFDSMHQLVAQHLDPLLSRRDWQDELAKRRQAMARTNEQRKQRASQIWRSVLDRIAIA